MRNEIIALHGASSEDGAQKYPQCFNLQITGSGSDTPSGILGTQLYSPTDPDILINIYASLSTYVVPGPTPYSGAVSITQSSSSITASGSPVTGTGAATTTTSTTAAGSTTSKTSVTSTPLATKTSTTTTTFHVTTATSPTTTASGSVGSTQTVYGQCGGSGWTGATACNSQATCSSPNPYYSQCLPTGP